MRSFVHAIADSDGLHARSCVVLANEAAKWQSDIIVSFGGTKANAKSMAELLNLHAEKGDAVSVSCRGEDEQGAAIALESLMRMSI